MSLNSNKKIFLALFFFFLILIFSKFFSLISFPDSSIVLEKEDDLQLKEGQSIQQKFIANRNNLSKIQILMRSTGIDKGNIIEMEIADDNCQNTIYRKNLEYSFLDAGNLYEFSFPKIKESKERKYCLIATLLHQQSKSAKFFTSSKNYSFFEAINISTGDKNEYQALSMRPAYKNVNAWQDIDELNKRISQYKPFFLKHYFLWTILILFLVSTVGLITIAIII